VGDGFGGEGEGSFFFYFARGSHESSEGGAGEGASYADSFDAGGCEFFDGKGCVLETHEDVDGFRDGGADLADGFEAGESGCVEDIGTDLGEGLQAAYGVLEIGPVVEEVLGACG